MLVISEGVRARFDEAKALARRIGLVSQFARQLNYLRVYGCAEGKPWVRVTLGYDFAPHSFSIKWERRQADGTWKFFMNGGLIFHGPHDGGGNGGPPTFSVCLQPVNGWSIHA